MSIRYSCYATCCLANQTVETTIPSFQVIKKYIKYLAIQPHKPIFYPSTSYDDLNVIRLTCSGNLCGN